MGWVVISCWWVPAIIWYKWFRNTQHFFFFVGNSKIWNCNLGFDLEKEKKHLFFYLLFCYLCFFFSINTFLLVYFQGQSTFVNFHSISRDVFFFFFFFSNNTGLVKLHPMEKNLKWELPKLPTFFFKRFPQNIHAWFYKTDTQI